MTAQVVNLAAFRASKAAQHTAGLLLAKEPRPGGSEMEALLIREEPRWVDHRDEPRHRTDGVCKPSLWLNGREASLQNVSRNGLMAAVDLPQGPGARVPVSVGGCPNVTGVVIWKRDGLVGLEVPIGSLTAA